MDARWLPDRGGLDGGRPLVAAPVVQVHQARAGAGNSRTPDPVASGGTIAYTITFKSAPVAVDPVFADVELTDVLPPQTTFSSFTHRQAGPPPLHPRAALGPYTRAIVRARGSSRVGDLWISGERNASGGSHHRQHHHGGLPRRNKRSDPMHGYRNRSGLQQGQGTSRAPTRTSARPKDEPLGPPDRRTRQEHATPPDQFRRRVHAGAGIGSPSDLPASG
jgi:uncharacterized repeat protein (TIGR01451 family)